jgi:xanthine dehydrogenase accessory factor
MESLDLRVLADALAWRRAGHAVQLVTVVETWGSAPRPPGALLAVRDDGVVSGSVSGGCVEDDLIARTKAAMQSNTTAQAGMPAVVTYGVSKEEATRFGLPCGGTLRLLQEPLNDVAWVQELLDRTASHELVSRSLHIPTGLVTLRSATRDQHMAFDGTTLTTLFGPRWRLLLVGAGQLSQAVAAMAQALDFEVLVCDPREEYAQPWLGGEGGAKRVSGMPDDAVMAMQPDPHTAIVALTHDPKLDDMALLEALRSRAFYVGALGSRRNQAARKARLKEHFDLTDAELDRLHGPVGLNIYAKTPAEIAVSIVAQMVQVKNAPSLVATAAQPTASGCAVDG